MTNNLEGKVALITGATSGNGRTLTRNFLRRGARVVGTGRRAELGEKIAEDLGELAANYHFVAGDVTSVASCEEMVRGAVDRFGRLDILVNNAGVLGDPGLVDSHEATEEWWDAIIDTNLKGAFFCSKYALAQMVEQRSGVIVNVASINGATSPIARMAAYNASKAGLVQLSKSQAIEYADRGIRSLVVILGGVDGETGTQAREALTRYVRGADAVMRQEDSKDVVMPSEGVADAIATLASDDCAQITGAEVAVDMGVTAGALNSTFIYMTASGVWKV
ncbi:3-oxoacyl-[acyl-carrier protein] reductase [Jatrophihabitans endophyticus]|uniref:3-oxoacyl-[acyl-carrier protein] reductase n=1 Tax=Jatrophihabitans endophyticus TaxID=1206085 RepID=A0A1M5PZ81_9ACTN|nr:SDR family oxidoreductase [Jatrophihabitans endophyticus]SHH06992.1 3-oxoacyl-[acyl-carrier protein] reductase [Jatrophihabitans endophyticus]